MSDLSGIPTDQLVQMLQSHPDLQGAQQPPPAEKPTSQLLGAAEGAYHMLDRAATGASKIPVLGPALDKLSEMTGLPTTEEANAAHQAAFAKREDTEKPGTAGKITGEVAASIPLAMVTRNPWLIGGATGALTSDSDTVGGTARDAAIGAVGGKAGEVAASGLGSVVSKAVNRFAPNAALSSGPASPSVAQAAGSYVARLMRASGLNPDDLIAAGNSSTKPLTSAEIIGTNGTTALGALARREGATGTDLRGLMKARVAGSSGRMLDDYASASGIDPALARGDIEDYVATGRKTVKPMFDQALAGDEGIWNSKLSMLSQRPVIERAMKGAVEDLKNADIDPAGLGFTGQDLATGKFVQMPRPTAQAWDLVKKALNKQVERDAFGKIIPDTQSPGNFNINRANRDLTKAMRDAIPGYGDALDASGDYLSMQKAYETGQDFILNPNVSSQQVVKHLITLSEPEQNAFKGGIANKLFEKAENGNLRPSVFLSTGATARPAIVKKLSAALGPDQATSFLGNIQRESEMASAAGRMAPGINSPTFEFGAAKADQDAHFGDMLKSGYDFASDLPQGLSKAVFRAVDRKAGNFIANRMEMPVSVRDEAGRLLMMHPSDLGTHLKSIAPQGRLPASVAQAGDWLNNTRLGNLTARVPQIAGAAAASGLASGADQ